MSKNLDLNTETEQELTGIQGLGKEVLTGWKMGRIHVERIATIRDLCAAIPGPRRPVAGFDRRRDLSLLGRFVSWTEKCDTLAVIRVN